MIARCKGHGCAWFGATGLDRRTESIGDVAKLAPGVPALVELDDGQVGIALEGRPGQVLERARLAAFDRVLHARCPLVMRQQSVGLDRDLQLEIDAGHFVATSKVAYVFCHPGTCAVGIACLNGLRHASMCRDDARARLRDLVDHRAE